VLLRSASSEASSGRAGLARIELRPAVLVDDVGAHGVLRPTDDRTSFVADLVLEDGDPARSRDDDVLELLERDLPVARPVPVMLSMSLTNAAHSAAL
jgi:hypothetical protein